MTPFPQHEKVYCFSDSKNPTSFSSFRPISLPPFISKILEQVCFKQPSFFLYSINAIPRFQSGFCREHSTTTSLLHLSDSVLRSFDEGCVSAIVTLDFTKAFDTVNHDLLLAKLKWCGLSSFAISLLRSFLSGRSQRVIIKDPFPILVSFCSFWCSSRLSAWSDSF